MNEQAVEDARINAELNGILVNVHIDISLLMLLLLLFRCRKCWICMWQGRGCSSQSSGGGGGRRGYWCCRSSPSRTTYVSFPCSTSLSFSPHPPPPPSFLLFISLIHFLLPLLPSSLLPFSSPPDPRVVQCIRRNPHIQKLIYVSCNPEGHQTIGNFVE